jgi:hypothetical protein
MGFYQLEPWGFHAQNLMAGVGAAATINVNLGKDATPVGAGDFLFNLADRYAAPAPEPEVPLDPDAVARQFELVLFGCVN